MSSAWSLSNLLNRKNMKTASAKSRPRIFRPKFERLEERTVPAFMMRFEQPGFGALDIVDNGMNDTNPASGVLSFSGSYGTYLLNLTTVLSKPGLGNANKAEIDFNTFNFSTATGGSLTITAADTDFNAPPNNPLTFESLIGGTINGAPQNSVSWQTWANTSNLSPISGPVTSIPAGSISGGLFGPFGPLAFNGSNTVTFSRDAGPYSLFCQTQINLFGSANAGFDGNFFVTGSELQSAILGDYVWEDLNANGIQEANEPGIPNVQVDLLDSTGTTVLNTTTTDSNGYYLFAVTSPNDYVVRFNPPGGYVFTAQFQGGDTKVDSNANTVTGLASVSFAPGQTEDLTIDAGLFKLAKLGDYVWVDTNADGIQNDGNTGLNGLTVFLNGVTGSGAVVALNTTTANNAGLDGWYQFDNLFPGSYTVSLSTPAGYVPTVTGQGTSATDSNGSPTSTVLISGGSDQTLDFGFYQLAKLGDYVWVDTNADGIQNDGNTGLNGLTVFLNGVTGSGAVVSTSTTTASNAGLNGWYQFDNLVPGSYTVSLSTPVGYSPTITGQGTTATDSNGSPTSTVLASGGSDQTLDFGFVQVKGGLSGKKWLDVCGDGLSADDKPFQGVTIYLDMNKNGKLDSGEPSTQTGADGSYNFDTLTPGLTYVVREVVPTGYIRTHPTVADSYSVTIIAGVNKGGNDFANFLKQDCLCDISCITYTINDCMTVTDLRGNTNQGDVVTVSFKVDAGATVKMSLVSYTAPGSSFDANTAYLQKVFDYETIIATGPGTFSMTVTIPDCYYQIDFVCGCVIEEFGPAGSNIFYTPQGRLISADNGGTNSCISNPGSIGGVKFNDLDGDGIKEAGEAGLGGWTIYIDSNNNGYKDSNERSTVTKPDGSYTLSNLPAGTYKVREVSKSGWMQTNALASVVLASGQAVTGANFGNFEKICISGVKFLDRNGDGVWDKNGLDNCSGNSDDETRLSGWTIYLDLNDNGVRDSGEPCDVTDSYGGYSFGNLGPGTYRVREVMQSGYVRTTDDVDVIATSGGDISVNLGNFKGNLVMEGDTATIGFWKNSGQALIKKFNGSSLSKNLGNWLATTFPKMYGSQAGSTNNMTNKTNNEVAAYFCTLFNTTGQLGAEVLATALSVYATSSTLAGGTYANSYGFTVTSTGCKNDSYNIGSNGAAFGVTNGSALTLIDILNRTNDRAVNGVLWGSNSTYRNMGYAVFFGINTAGEIV